MGRMVGLTAVLLLGLVIAGNDGFAPVSAQTDPNAYFNALAARPDVFRAYSLRDQAQLLQYRQSTGRGEWVTYDPANDPDPRRQDAAKVVIPPFDDRVFTSLVQPMTPDQTSLVVTASDSALNGAALRGRALKIDDEIVVVNNPSGVGFTNSTIVPVLRGQHGTTATSHASNTPVFRSINSLLNQVRLPLGTEDGRSYLITWDTWFGAEFAYARSGISGYKNFQISSGGIWYEIQTRFNEAAGGDIGRVTARGYGTIGPNVSDNNPISPMPGTFTIRPERWTRYWALVDQRANDYDLLSLWVADTETDPVQILDRREMESRASRIEEFYLEYNTSENTLRAGRGTLVSYVRNLVALSDVGDPTGLMQRPGAGGALPPPSSPPPPSSGTRPSAPRNLRIIPPRL